MRLNFTLKNIHSDAVTRVGDELFKLNCENGPVDFVHLERKSVDGKNCSVRVSVEVSEKSFLKLCDESYPIVINFIYNLIDALYHLTSEAKWEIGGVNRETIANLDLKIDTEDKTILDKHFHVTCDFENTGDDYENKHSALVDIINNYHYANEEYTKGSGDPNIFQLAHSIDEGKSSLFKMIAKGENDMSCASIRFDGLKQTTIGTLLLIHDLESNEHFSKLANIDLIYLPGDEENGDKVYRLFIDNCY